MRTPGGARTVRDRATATSMVAGSGRLPGPSCARARTRPSARPATRAAPPPTTAGPRSGRPVWLDVDAGVHDRQRAAPDHPADAGRRLARRRAAGPGPRRRAGRRGSRPPASRVGQGCAEVIWPSLPAGRRVRSRGSAPVDNRWVWLRCHQVTPKPHLARRSTAPGRPQPQAGAAGSGAGTPTVGMPSPTPGPGAAGAAVRASQASPARVRRTDRTGPSATRWCGAA